MGSFHCEALERSGAKNILVQFSQMYTFPLNGYQGVELLACGVCLCSALFDIPKWLENVYSVNGFLESKNQGDG